ncbi:hypothetical protein MASR2M15_06820 [Anaerolineales bacterium]
MRYLLVILSLWVFGLVSAAQEGTATPSPAPSKTATVEKVSVTATATEAKATPKAPSGEVTLPFIQEDFRILVGNVQRPNGLVEINGFLFAVCNGDWTTYQVDSVTGDTVSFVNGVRNAHTLFAENTSAGFNIWIPDFDTNRLLMIDQSRNSPRQIVNLLEGPWGIDAYDEDSFVVSNLKANNVVRITREGVVDILVDGLRAPAGVAVDTENVYVANTGSARRAIEWFKKPEKLEGDAEYETPELKPLVSGVQSVSSLFLHSDGFLYFSYALGSKGAVGRVSPEACLEEGCTGDQVEIVALTDLSAPLAGLTISPDNRLFIHTIYLPEIYWVQLSQ